MTWSVLVSNGTVRSHATSKQEIESLRELVERDIKDAGLSGLSADRQFATAYNAALQLCKMAITCSGYRISQGTGHHQKTFEVVKIAISTADAGTLADYFEVCRRKRNVIDYDAADTITETEADEIIKNAVEFQNLIENWIADNYPAYKK